MSHKYFLACLTLLFLSFTAGAARADTVIFSNFGAGMTYNTAGGFSVTGAGERTQPQVIANRFTSTGDFNFGSAQLALGAFSGTNVVQVLLQTDAGGVPGATIESANVAFGPSPPGSVVTFTSALNPLLRGGVNYWLVAFAPNADTRALWNSSLADFSDGSNFAFNNIPSQNGPWSLTGDGFLRGAFQINGTAPGAPIPEPATMILLGTGLAGVVAKGRRGKSKRTAAR